MKLKKPAIEKKTLSCVIKGVLSQGHGYNYLKQWSCDRMRVCVGGRAWLGEGSTPQAARHDAAARALQDLRPMPQSEPEADNGTGPAPRCSVTSLHDPSYELTRARWYLRPPHLYRADVTS